MHWVTNECNCDDSRDRSSGVVKLSAQCVTNSNYMHTANADDIVSPSVTLICTPSIDRFGSRELCSFATYSLHYDRWIDRSDLEGPVKAPGGSGYVFMRLPGLPGYLLQ